MSRLSTYIILLSVMVAVLYPTANGARKLDNRYIAASRALDALALMEIAAKVGFQTLALVRSDDDTWYRTIGGWRMYT